MNNKSFSVRVQIIQESEKILNTGGGILNMIEHCKDNDFLIFNPDTLWNENIFLKLIKCKIFIFQIK